MNEYVGLDVSLDVAHFCIVDETGAVAARGRAATEPAAIAAALRERSNGGTGRVMHETGGLARCLQCELEAEGVLKAMPNKTDKQDAHALTRLTHAGFIPPVAGKSRETQLVRALLTARQQVKSQRRGSRRSAPSGSPQAASTSAV